MSLEEKDLIKGLGQVMNQDTFRAVREKKSGLIQFNPVKMVNVLQNMIKAEEHICLSIHQISA